MKIESLDDLFDDDNKDTEQKETENSFNSEEKSQLEKDMTGNNALEEERKKEDEEYDLQKELEAKFDELFGPIDDNED